MENQSEKTEVKKIPIEEIENMTSAQIVKYIEAITQNPLCADKKYCDQLIKIYLSKPMIHE